MGHWSAWQVTEHPAPPPVEREVPPTEAGWLGGWLSLGQYPHQATEPILFEPGALGGLEAELGASLDDLGVLDRRADQARGDNQLGQQRLLDRMHEPRLRLVQVPLEPVPQA